MIRASQYLRLAFLAAWLAVSWYCRNMDPWRGFLVVSLAFVVLTPTLHPWYLLWLLAPAVMERSGASILLCTTVLFQYRVLDGWWAEKSWEMPAGTRWLVIVYSITVVHLELVFPALFIRISSRIKMMATPQTMALSAMLKLGQTYSVSPR